MNKLTVASLAFPTFPVKDLLIIESLTQISSKLYYSIFDSTGKEIITNNLIDSVEDLIKISVASLKNGMYLLRLYNDESYVVNSFSVAK
jgi:hypothetical protein